MPILL